MIPVNSVEALRPKAQRCLINKVHVLPVTKQSELLRVSRSSAYYEQEPVRAEDLLAMWPWSRCSCLGRSWTAAGICYCASVGLRL